MKKFYVALLQVVLLLCTWKASALNVLVTQTGGGPYTMPANWQTVLTAMGHTVNLQPISVLNNTSFFATTNVLIVSDGTATYTPTQISTIQAFLQSGKPVYLQSEYLSTYDGNQAFAQLVNALGGSFSWGATQTDDQNPNIFGTFATTNNSVPTLPYFWYGCTGTGSANVFTFVKSTPGAVPLGWCFCPPNSSYGKLITTSDQDWIQNISLYPTGADLMENIFTHLITPNLCGPSGPSNPTGTITAQTNVSCNGGSNGSATVAVSGGTPPYSYSWAPSGGTGASISGRTAGTYTVTITDANGLTGTASVAITQPSALVASNTTVNPTCNGSCNGTSTFTASGGTGPYAYSWSPGGNTGSTISALCAGIYTCTVTDAKGCTITLKDTLTAPAAIQATAISQNNVGCNGGNNGSATIGNVTGGTAPYTYSWAPGGATGATATGLVAGNVTCTITDTKGCTGSQLFTITQPVFSVQPQDTTLCSGNNASFKVASSGTGLNYQWQVNTGSGFGNISDGGVYSGTQTNTLLLTGATTTMNNYQYRCTVGSSCSSPSTAAVLTVKAIPAITSASSNSPTGCGGSNGSITLAGLTANTTYMLSYAKNGAPVAAAAASSDAGGNIIISNLGAGTYTDFQITLNGCSGTLAGPVTLSNPTAPVLTSLALAGSNPVTCGGTQGTISISGLIAGNSYQVHYTQNATAQLPVTTVTDAAGTLNLSGLGAGTYDGINVTLNGCVSNSVGPVTLNDPALPVVTVPAQATLCAGDTLFLSATSNDPSATFSWSGPAGYNATVQNPLISATTTGMNGYYIATAHAHNCNSVPDTTSVVINALPGAPGVTPIAYCKDATAAALTATGNNLRWYTTGSGGTGTTTAPIPSTATAGTTTWHVSQTNANGCEGPRAALTVTINDRPAITLGTTTNPTTCGGTQGTISISGLTTSTGYTLNYLLNGTPAVPVNITSTTTGDYTIIGLVAGAYTGITATNNSGCSSMPLGPVTLNDPPPPAAPVPAVNGPICATQTLNLSAATVSNAVYTWTGPNSFSSSSQNPAIGNATTAASGTYSVTVTVSNCTSLPGTVSATVKPKPAAPAAGSNSPICAGENLNLTASAVTNAVYAWTGPNSFSSSDENPSVANAGAPASGTYSVHVTVDGCTSDNMDAVVVVNALPAAPGVSNIAYCQFETAAALTASGTSLKWYTASSGGTPLTTAPLPATTVAGSTTWYVSQTNANGCEGPRAALTVTVKPKPALPVALAPSAYTFCQYSLPASLAANGQNLLWYTNSNNIGTTSFVPNTNTPGTSNVYVTQTIDGCESDRLPITITVKAKPDPPVVASPKVFCQNDAATALQANGQNLMWYTSVAGGVGSNTAPVPNTSVEDTFYYYVSQTVDGCESDRALLEVHVLYKPTAQIIPSRAFVCAGDTMSFTYLGNGRPDAVYNWKNPVPQSNYISGGGQGPWVVQFDSAGTQTVRLIVDNHGCLSNEATQSVEVRPLPQLRIAAPPDICLGATASIGLDQSTPNISSFSWDFDGGNPADGDVAEGPYTVHWNAPGIYVVSVTGVSRQCRSLPAKDTIMVRPMPPARITQVSNNNVCAGDSIELQAQDEGTDYTYQWSPENYFSSSTGTDVWAQPAVNAYLFLTVTDTAGCSSRDSVAIATHSCCEMAFPNAFTPNGDGKNDLFRVISEGHQSVSTFRVMNRWGQVVYESADARRGWDGTFSGTAQAMGTYYYYIRYRCTDGKNYEQRGELTLIR